MVKAFNNIINLKKYAYKSNSNSKRTLWKFLNSLDITIMAISKSGLAEFDSIFVGQEVRKSEDYG